jgi:hypothetical protein
MNGHQAITKSMHHMSLDHQVLCTARVPPAPTWGILDGVPAAFQHFRLCMSVAPLREHQSMRLQQRFSRNGLVVPGVLCMSMYCPVTVVHSIQGLKSTLSNHAPTDQQAR